MSRSSNKIYTIDSTDMAYIERVWTWACDHGVAMYKTRVTKTIVRWVVELPGGTPIETQYILTWGSKSTCVMGTYYV